MGCNRCKQKQMVNRLDSPDHIALAKNVYETIILAKTINEYDDLDRLEIHRAFDTLYPNASAVPSLEDAINQIRIGLEVYGTKYKR